MTSYSNATIIFDLGNVILPFDPLPPCARLGELCALSAHEVASRIYSNNLERWFEAGIINGSQFTERVGNVLNLELEEDSLRPLWANIFEEDVAVSALIRRLRNHHPLIILSNTNVWHWQHACEHFAIVREIPSRVLSYEEGVLKPHPAIYRAALEKAERSRPAIFIDDIENNAAAARMMGITGVHFQSASQLERDLRDLGCILN
jgi:FMN phosphatase YigB (HAD superfamily)